MCISAMQACISAMQTDWCSAFRYERDMAVNMQHESQRLETLCAQEEQQINRLSEVLDLIETFDRRSRPSAENPLSLDECADLFKKLQVRCRCVPIIYWSCGGEARVSCFRMIITRSIEPTTS